MPDEDVTKLTDEELDAKIEGKEPEEPAKEEPETPDSEEKPSEEEAPAEPEEPETPPVEPEKTPEEEPKPPSRRETLRIQQILAKREKAAQAPQQPSQPELPKSLNYEEALNADPAVIAQLEADRRATAQAQYDRGLQQAQQFAQAQAVASEFRTNLKIDYPLVKDKLDKLDPADVDALNVEYLQMVGYDEQTGLVANPAIGYADYVEARYEQAERLAASMNVETVKNVTKQAAQTGLRPDGSSAKTLNLNKNPEDMTDEELDAVLASGGLATKKRR